jgi:signal transduction histidine kinase
LVELHGGTFAIESKINFGTTVTFVLPPERVIASPARLTAAMPAG